eukprot:gene51629-63122_t
MSAIKPIVLLPRALTARGADIARQFVDSLTLGSGQCCTNPGLLIGIDWPALRRVEAAA